ncbi:uncharacterized protein RHO25_011137 [Cercospora beticola]|uniref:Uncharacterized protein n=1 Tax=Cercospora beticola TaxID=122368 RepID=A0ABZ0P4F1_CERBT|nr:hypothetical protein RHO25_011137 [Cercospora beticola]CAK1366385.1 unnamed protein product [Cercospora beticola]
MASAVDRVFGTPELLEQILLYVADLDLNVPSTPDQALIYFVTSTISLQRVDQTFRNTILGSTKLRRRQLEAAEKPGVERYFEPFHASHNATQMDIDPAIFGPLLWLEEQMIFILRFRGVARAHDGVLTIAFHILFKDKMMAWLEETKEQSWRQVRCLTSALNVPGLRLEAKCDTRWRSGKIARILDLESTATLGQVANILEDCA